MFIDSHCHLDFEQFDADRNAVVERAKSQGVSRFIVPGVTQSSWQRVVELAQTYPEVSIAFGLHPYFIEQHQQNDLEILASLLEKHQQQVIAVGEIGLDKTSAHFEQQRFLFEQQLILAEKYRLPVIVHNRKADAELIALFKQYPTVTGVIHAFSGSLQQARQFIELGFKLGVGGVITYPRAIKTRKTVSQLPLQALLLETDAPDMPLNGEQGGRNEPGNIVKIFNQLLELRPESKEILQAQIFQNTLNLFGLKK